MAGVAALAKAAGHQVTGSDRAVYPPMSDQLAALGIDIVEGYDAGQLSPTPDVVVVGNVMSRGMPVIEALLNSRIPYASGPEWLAREILGPQRVLAVTGTHGKTTTSSLLAWILDQAGLEPGFLIGGLPVDFATSARLGGGSVFVIEADEYDTAFFDKQAKFLHYAPDVVVINNLEFDHADIYADLAAIQWQFHQLIRRLPGAGHLFTRGGDANIDSLLAKGCWTPVVSYASDPRAAVEWTGSTQGDDFVVARHGTECGRVEWSLRGDHNAENAIAALLAAGAVGVELDTALAAIGSFGGVRRRLELRGEFGGVMLYDDFAHHPTAIRRTLDAIRNAGGRAGGDARILIVLEPRSNTMRMGVHKDALAGSLRGADAAWVYAPGDLDWDLAGSLADSVATVHTSTTEIVAEVAAYARPGDHVIVMSNGGFDGIHTRLASSLAATAQ